MGGIFLKKLLPPPDNRGLLPTLKETYDLNLSAITLSIWSFRTPTSIFLPTNFTILVYFHPLVGGVFPMTIHYIYRYVNIYVCAPFKTLLTTAERAPQANTFRNIWAATFKILWARSFRPILL